MYSYLMLVLELFVKFADTADRIKKFKKKRIG